MYPFSRTAPLSLTLLVALVACQMAQAAGNLYRYKNDKGVVVIDSSIPPAYASKGYQIITSSGHVVQDVPPAAAAINAEDMQKKLEAGAQLARRDVELRKLYSSPADAERLRDRQLGELTAKIASIRSLVQQSQARRKTELEKAANLERQGMAAPPTVRDNIDRLDRQIKSQEENLKTLEADRLKKQDDFAPVIERLKVIYPHKTVQAPAVSAPAAPSVAAPPPATAPATADPKKP